MCSPGHESGAIPLICGDAIYGGNTGAPSVVSDYGCDCWSADGPEVVYEFTVSGGWSTFSAVLLTADPDVDLYLLDSCNEGDCIDCGDSPVYEADLAPMPPHADFAARR